MRHHYRLVYSFLLFATAHSVVSMSELCAAQETFNYQGSNGVQAWDVPAKWTGGSGMFSSYPGESPAVGTLDSVNLAAIPLAGQLDLRVTTPGLTIDNLQLGTNTTIVRGEGAGTFTLNRVEALPGQSGTIGLFGTFAMPSDTVEFRPGVSATFRGTIVNRAPVASEIRTISNESQTTLDVESNVVLSDDPSVAGHLRFLNGGLPASTEISGVISDGAAPGGRVNFGRGVYYLVAENTYSGVTQIGENAPQVETIVEIYTDLAFGTSRIDISGGQALKTIRGSNGRGTRTLANDIRISRTFEVAGSESFVLNGLVYQSNGRELRNSLSAGKTLTINGNIFASDSTDVRDWIFEGLGLTIVNSIIDDSLDNPQVSGTALIKRDGGRVVLTNPNVAAYGGSTTVSAGVLQLGNGGPAVGLNGNPVSGAAIGTLEINHSQSLVFDSAIGGQLNLKHVGPGTTEFTADSNGSGNLAVQAGKVLVEGTLGTGTVTVSQGATLGGSGAIAGPLQTSGVVSPGASAGLLSVGSVNFSSTAELFAEIGGIAAGDNYDQLLVATSAALAGELVVDLIAGFAPLATDSFTILSAAALSGAFGNIANGARLDTLGGEGSFLVSYNSSTNSVVLSDFLSAASPALAGDYNNDGIVDATDYTVWRDNLGSDTPLLNETASPGIVDQDDYLAWKSNFGGVPEGAGSVSLAVPEPTSVAMLLIGLLAALAAGFRRIP